MPHKDQGHYKNRAHRINLAGLIGNHRYWSDNPIMSPLSVWARSSECKLWLYVAGCSCGTPNSWSGNWSGNVTHFPALGILFFLLGCFFFALTWGSVFSLIVMLCHVWLKSLGGLIIFKRQKEEEQIWGRTEVVGRQAEVEGWETAVTM